MGLREEQQAEGNTRRWVTGEESSVAEPRVQKVYAPVGHL